MYRRSRKHPSQIARLANARAAKERKRLDGSIPADAPDLLDLRRVIEITDYDTGSPVVHRIELYPRDGIDCYNGKTNDQPW